MDVSLKDMLSGEIQQTTLISNNNNRKATAMLPALFKLIDTQSQIIISITQYSEIRSSCSFVLWPAVQRQNQRLKVFLNLCVCAWYKKSYSLGNRQCFLQDIVSIIFNVSCHPIYKVETCKIVCESWLDGVTLQSCVRSSLTQRILFHHLNPFVLCHCLCLFAVRDFRLRCFVVAVYK